MKSLIKQQLPTIVMVMAFVSFMNAKDAQAAAVSGSLALVALAWTVFRSRKTQQSAGEVLMTLGRMQPIGPDRVRGWQVLAAFAFLLLGLFMLFNPEETWGAYARWGMAIMCWGIVGAQLASLPDGHRVGVAVFAVGFTVGGLLIVAEAWTVLNSNAEQAALTATKWCVLSAFILIGGITGLMGVLRNGGETVLYRQGVIGPWGLVPWDAVESLELRPTVNDPAELRIGAYRGWTLSIDVPKEKVDAVQQFVAEQQTDRVESTA
ncbi:MAG: hypothetical protein Fues2KO_39150 [Fuerstiella sp.]